MKIVLQRVKTASVTVDGKVAGSIGRGYVVLLGVSDSDDKNKVEKLVNKIHKLRIFPDENGKTNLNIGDIINNDGSSGGDLLVVSQFTLYADTRKGNRPSFVNAAAPDLAEELYDYFIEYAGDKFTKVEGGVFGAAMDVELVNDGPFTLLLEV